MARILLAEDDESLRFFLARSLENAGHEVLAFADGEDVLPVLEAGPYDILISDIVMPRLGGIELAMKCKELIPELPVIFITGFAAVSIEAFNTVQGTNKMLSKPFHLNSLVEAVDRVVEETAACF